MLEAACRGVSTALFVGDMDPYGIVQYVETRRMLAASKGPSLVFGGVDDSWFASMDRARRRRGTDVRIPLSRAETTLLQRIDDALDLEAIVGAKGCALLRDGFKIELEGATNPMIYRRGHGAWIFRHLRALVRG